MKITALGGYEGVGSNMTLVKECDTQVAIDCGISLDSFLLYYGNSGEGIEDIKISELIRIGAIPDMGQIKGGLDAFLISHGHLDHIGALPLFVDKYNSHIIATRYASGLITGKLKKQKQHLVSQSDYGKNIQISPDMSAEFIQVTHSIPDASMIHLQTKNRSLLYACDYKFDDHSRIARTDYRRLKRLGNQNLNTLIVEALSSGEEGKTLSESVARDKIKDIMSFAHDNEQLILATTFSTHVERIQALVERAHKLGRKILILGRSYLANCELGEKFGLLDLPEDTIVVPKSIDSAFKQIEKQGREKYFVLVTGHQGEPGAVLTRIADKKFKFHLQNGDAVIFASRVIPTDVNIANRSQLEDKLKAQGVRIFYDAHVSGHASKEEHRKLLKLTNPEHIIPAHGNMEMIGNYVVLAESEGYKLGKNIHIMRNGNTIKL